MLKRSITYKDLFTDEEVTENFYFNFTTAELVELQFSEKEGLAEFLQRIVDEVDKQELIKRFKWLIMKAYGVREGNRFVKSDELSLAFSQSAAYDSLFNEFVLGDSADAFSNFVNGVMPKDLVKKAAELAAKDKVATPPLPPVRS